jgi:hypothetical protein
MADHSIAVAPAFSPIALTIEDAPRAVGVSRTRIFEAMRNKEIAARKAGRVAVHQDWHLDAPIDGFECVMVRPQ